MKRELQLTSTTQSYTLLGKTYDFEFWHQRYLMGAIIKALQDPEVASKIE